MKKRQRPKDVIIRNKKNASYHPKRLDVHHFKWDSLLIPRLKKRYLSYKKQKIKWFRESGRLLRYFQQNPRIPSQEISRENFDSLRYFDDRNLKMEYRGEKSRCV